MKDEIEVTVTKPLTELQLTKDSSIHSIPLSNDAYEKVLEEDEYIIHHVIRWRQYYALNKEGEEKWKTI